MRLSFDSVDLEKGVKTQLFTMENVITHNSMRMMSGGEMTVSGLHGFGMIYPDGTVKEISESDGAVSLNSAFVERLARLHKRGHCQVQQGLLFLSQLGSGA